LTSHWEHRLSALIHRQKKEKTSLCLRNQADRIRLRQRNYHQRGDTIMAQGALPFKYEEQRQFGGMTALAGLPV